MGCAISTLCCPQPLFLDDEDEMTEKKTPERRKTFFRSNSFKSGVLIKTNRLTTLEVTLRRVEVEESDVNDDDDDAEDADPIDPETLDICTEPNVYVGGGIPGVAVDEFTIELPKYTGQTPGGIRSFSKGIWWGSRTRAGNDSMGRRKENQDSFVIRDKFAECDALTFVCVMDGHGSQGAFVSHYVRDRYPLHVADAVRRNLPLEALDNASLTLELVEDIFLEASCRMTAQLEEESGLDISVSGSTAVALLLVTPSPSYPHLSPHVFIANVGDSRAVAGVPLPDASTYEPHVLSVDHKPDVPSELARILATNGRVFEWGVPRVWLKDVDMPGLAMSRSFGDSVATSVGVISDPACAELSLAPGTFVVVASDGLWEFLSSAQVVSLGAKCLADGLDPQTLCDMLVAEALERWLDEEDVVDDITVTVLYAAAAS
ncbi:protein phosphatase 2C [Achlya hypogyna]|uniref:Protein phosphatase 2C n=1 Tax=Achlya hypogyna TaxID=1202772 RepID=A0A1V9ZH00_ACHHY|nr:protein phosphatase 2C [Achlya hypogyna]